MDAPRHDGRVALAAQGRRRRGDAGAHRRWRAGDFVQLTLPMPVRRVLAHPEVKADQDRFAIERGPLVYCAEGADNDGRVLDKRFPGKVRLESASKPELLGGIVTVKLVGEPNGDALNCIPYYAWGHRGANEMRVWFPVTTGK